MARIAGVDLPENKRIDYALTLLYGVGWPLSLKILNQVGIKPETRVGKLQDKDLSSLTREVEGVVIEGALRHQTREDIKRLVAIGSYRGTRHNKNLPARGQRTKTNARTKRGKRRTVGAFKKEMLAKQQKATTGK